MTIAVIDYQAGNAPSVGYALARLGIDHRLITTPEELDGADRIILPGVGAAAATMESLRSANLIPALEDRVLNAGTPFLGICIGLQVLFENSEEGAPTDGPNIPCLGWIPGTITRFPSTVRVPQIGWNLLSFARPHPLTIGLPADNTYTYFVNSYYAQPTNAEDLLATADYAGPFTAMVARNNIAATQFHAEKSGELGLTILKNFAGWTP
ncbi:MAG: imidazole glycerol phosphate synthase subunit HisH [Acidimicrobiia bacterium]